VRKCIVKKLNYKKIETFKQAKMLIVEIMMIFSIRTLEAYKISI